jgi:Protein of unknown function (DUF3551)
MKFLLLFLSGFCVSIVGISEPAEAQNYPWCAIYTTGGTNCGFTTFEQCMDTASGLGSLCQPNTQYQLPPGPHQATRIRKRYPE